MIITQKIKNKIDFYLTFLELLVISKDFDIVTNDIKVLAYLYNKHDEFFNRLRKEGKEVEEVRTEIGKYILSTEVRKELAKEINIPGQSFTNSISKLRKEGLLAGNILFYFGETLHTYLYTHSKLELIVKFDV